MSDLKIFSKDIPVKDKRVIVRLDLNVPINKSKIDDHTRIEIIEPFSHLKLISVNASTLFLLYVFEILLIESIGSIMSFQYDDLNILLE